MGAPQTDRNHRQHVIESRDRVAKACEESNGFAFLRVGKGRLSTQEHKHSQYHCSGQAIVARRVHRPPPKSSASLCTVQNAPREPTVYPGSACDHRGQRTSSMRNDRSSARISAIKPSCPSSTPTLKLTKASGSSCRGSPALVSALAKPKPWSSPKVKATTQGWRIVKLVCPRHDRTISGPRKRMLNAIAAFSGRTGTSA